ncbi:hypothetical protein OUZ56_028399 [Daphnia magna]|uniref:Uncharacterized protein n=1 Tax=Daphnia magna TaxID=35525 RepID=A0ABR0B3R6_9CRUS|nr:hypothetical protein OUZ56_028399 [Daphnia magna]
MFEIATSATRRVYAPIVAIFPRPPGDDDKRHRDGIKSGGPTQKKKQVEQPVREFLIVAAGRKHRSV